MKKLRRLIATSLILMLCCPFFVACKDDDEDTVSATELTADMVVLAYTSIEYDGEEKKPAVEVKIEEDTIEETNYSVSYSDNKNVGKASVKVSATEDSEIITGSVTVNFNITAGAKTVSSLAELKTALDNSNISRVALNQDLVVDEKLSIAQNKSVDMQDFVITNNSEIENNGKLYLKKPIVGEGVVTGSGEIVTKADSISLIKSAIGFADRIVVVANIPAATEQELLEDSASATIKFDGNRNYDLIVDLAGHKIERALRFEKEAGYDYKVSVINSESTKAIIGGVTGYGIVVRGDSNASTEKFEIKLSGLQSTGLYGGLASNGYDQGATISANNCSFIGTYDDISNKRDLAVGVYLPGKHVYNFDSCEFTGYTGYYAKSGNHTLTNCKVVGNGQEYISPEYYGDGGIPTGSGLIVDSSEGYMEPMNVNISGGKIISAAGYAIQKYQTATSVQNLKGYATLNYSPSVVLEGEMGPSLLA